MKVLVADTFEARGHEALVRMGCDVVSRPGLGPDDLAAALREHDPDILLVRSTKVREDAILAGRRLELIIRAGAGYDTIDVASASREGVFVANCPGQNAIAVAELTWALITGCDRRLPDQVQELRAGTWNKKEYSQARGLHGRTLGVLGTGTIAREVVLRGKAFGMRVVAWSRSLTDERAGELGVIRAAEPLDVARVSDVVTVHLASTPETRHFIGDAFIDAMKSGAYLINTSRGALVDESALLRGIAEKGLRAGLDVYQGEPSAGMAPFEHPIAQSRAVYGTHHVGASTDQAQDAIANEAVRIVARYRATGTVANCVNLAERSSATYRLTVRHRNRPGVLARIFQVLSEAGINVEEMDNVLYQGVKAACARIQLARAPSEQDLQRIRESCEHILSMELASLADTGQ